MIRGLSGAVSAGVSLLIKLYNRSPIDLLCTRSRAILGLYRRHPDIRVLAVKYWTTASSNMEIKGRVIVYSILGCPHCMRAKDTLQNKGIPYTDISLDTYPQCREEVKSRTGRQTVPQVFFNARHIGGNDDLQKLVTDRSEWDAIINELKDTPPGSDAPQIPDPSTAVKDSDAGDFTCEPDEYAKLVQDLKASGLIKDHSKILTTYKRSFVGREFVDWVVKTKGLDRNVAVDMGQALIDKHFGHNVKSEEVFQDSPDKYYRLLEDDESTALNAGETSQCEPKPADELGEEIRKLILKIYNAFLSKDGKKVNYRGIAGSSEFERYKKLTKELHRVRISESTREEKLSFFINIYNALVIHANVTTGPATNLWQRYKFFNTIRYIIGGESYSLQDIENGVLRANRKGVGMFTRPFSHSDPRFKVALEKHEPLIHFALVCGAKSCPPIKTYSTAGIYEQLTVAAESFLDGDDGCQIDMQKRQIRLSKILKWYEEDFGKNKEEVLHWIQAHLPEGDRKSQLTELLDSKKYRVNYMEYDWGVNS
ncbi:LOW QUALITY PROTEIN: uncharacterized protein LOC117325864 [Pecten maximus]|uniref:LOW QUALITY PROTEIN: uncharacterized protein LOC117325864 n=1 Tax=Pecten maximus TaxID=6579 RepID=UPI0014583C48|nr:LOW QUALITY PROTEIN: uncharacterized protein LOC117325864 [Pecten maximus]